MISNFEDTFCTKCGSILNASGICQRCNTQNANAKLNNLQNLNYQNQMQNQFQNQMPNQYQNQNYNMPSNMLNYNVQTNHKTNNSFIFILIISISVIIIIAAFIFSPTKQYNALVEKKYELSQTLKDTEAAVTKLKGEAELSKSTLDSLNNVTQEAQAKTAALNIQGDNDIIKKQQAYLNYFKNNMALTLMFDKYYYHTYSCPQVAGKDFTGYTIKEAVGYSLKPCPQCH